MSRPDPFIQSKVRKLTLFENQRLRLRRGDESTPEETLLGDARNPANI